jgi:hypothetical protein
VVGACQAERQASGTSAEELIARAVGRYRAAASYSDRGTIRTTVGEHVSERAFETRLDTAGRFQFDLYGPRRGHSPLSNVLDRAVPDPHRRPYRIVIGNGEARRTRSDGTSEALASAVHALSAGTGVSRGAVLIVPPLLLDLEKPPSLLASMTATRHERASMIGGHRCEEIAGLDRSGNDMTLWLREDGVLCRVERRIAARVPQAYSVRIDYEDVTLTP